TTTLTDTSFTGEYRGGVGSDTLTIAGASSFTGTILDGGDDASTADGFVDVLTLDGVTQTVNSGTIVNWETIKLVNSDLIFD
ncbi:unnamed protein product, partial [Laminaria digitata]